MWQAFFWFVETGRFANFEKNGKFASQIKRRELKQRTRKILSLIALLLFAAYYAGATLFSHTHFIDGEQIVHSHFSFGGNGSSHTHSKAELQLIALLTTFSIVAVAAVSLMHIERPLIGSVSIFNVLPTDRFVGSISLLRAPPMDAISA